MKALSLFVFSAALAAAQIASTSTYDPSQLVKLRGTVTRIDWSNPNAYVFVNTRDASGLVNWAVEIGSALDLERSGWTLNTLHIGDVVTVEASPARGPAHQALAKSVVSEKSGKKLFTITPRVVTKSTEPAPRWPDGRVRLGPAPGKSGYWTSTSANLADNQAGKIAMSADGLLKNLSDLDRVAPFQPWARSVYEYRQRTLLKDDPVTRCLPPGGPRQFQTPPGFRFIEQKDLGRILVLLGGGDRNWRVIYTDGRAAGQADETVRGYYGTSAGHWEKDTLVVETTGFNEHFWFANGGLPHTEALHLTERFTRTDMGTLKYEVTVDDPRTYTRPWTSSWQMEWIAGEEMPEYFCEDNAETTFVR